MNYQEYPGAFDEFIDEPASQDKRESRFRFEPGNAGQYHRETGPGQEGGYHGGDQHTADSEYTNKGHRPRFKLIPFNKLKPRAQPDYLIQGLLPRRGTAIQQDRWAESRIARSDLLS